MNGRRDCGDSECNREASKADYLGAKKWSTKEELQDYRRLRGEMLRARMSCESRGRVDWREVARMLAVDPAKVARAALEAAIEAMCPVFEVARNYTDGTTDARRSSLLSAEGCIRSVDIAAIIEAARKAP